MKQLFLLIAVFLSLTAASQFCPYLGPDQILPCGINSTTLTADLSQCGPGGPGPNETTDYSVSVIPYVAQTNTGTSITMSDDTQQGPFNIGFNFCFYGVTYTQFYIGSNGWISFSAGQSTSFTSASIPSAAISVPRNCIMGPWQDWHPGLGGQIRYQTSGVAPCRKLTVSWIGVPMFSCTGNQGTFHIVIYESTNYIENYIQDKPACLGWQNGTAVEGIHDVAGTAAVTVPGRNSTAWTANNDAWRWTPAGPVVTPTLTWYEVGNPVALGTGPTLTVTPPAIGANYTCQFVYPTCNAGWVTCNAIPGLGPDTVFVQPGPPVPIPGPITYSDTVCLNGSATYSIPDMGYVYNWSSVGNITNGQGTNTITVNWTNIPAGMVPDAVTVTAYDGNLCTSFPIGIDLTIFNVLPTISQIGPFCSNDACVPLTGLPLNGIFSGDGVSGTNFCPSLGNLNNLVTYSYTQSGCVFTNDMNVTVNPQPYINSISPSNQFYELCEGDSLNLVYNVDPTINGITTWVVLNDITETDNLSITWDQFGIYIIEATETVLGCVSPPIQTTINIVECPQLLIYVPNTFTPDGNEFNNLWGPVFTSGYSSDNFELLIFNRWGEIIWESRDPHAKWDGTYNNKLVLEGVYTWTIRFDLSNTAEKRFMHGFITLIR
jgi:gliding motility-associated-like protein